MKIRVTGGSKDLNKEIVTGEFSGMAKATPSKPIKGQKKVDDVVVENKKEIEEDTNDKSVNGVPTDEKKVVCPVEFDENLIKKNESKPDSFEIFAKCLGDALEIFGNLHGSTKEIANDLICKTFKAQIEEAVKKSTKKLEDELTLVKNKLEDINKEAEDCCEKENISKDMVIYHLDKAVEIYDKLENSEEEDDMPSWIVIEIQKLINSISFYDMEEIFMRLFIDNYKLSIKDIKFNNISLGENESDDSIIKLELYPQIIQKITDEDDPVSFENASPISMNINIEDIDAVIRGCNMTIVVKEDWDRLIEKCENNNDSSSEEVIYGDLKFFAAKVINPKDVDPDQEPGKVIMIMDENNNYLTIGKDNNIIAIDSVDDRSVESLSIVSKQWLYSTLKQIKDMNESFVNENDNSETSISNIATGILAPNISVNGVEVNEGDDK